MSSFNKKLNQNNQFIIGVKVIKCLTEKQYKDGTAQNLIISNKPRRALIDTGASSTCICQEYADELQLIAIGQSTIMTADDECDVNRYKIDLAIPVATTSLRPTEENGKKGVGQIIIDEKHWTHFQYNIHSIPSVNRDRGFDLILGMDILSRMHITMFNGDIIMSF